MKSFTFLETIIFVWLFWFLMMAWFESLRFIFKWNEFMLERDKFKREFIDFEKDVINNFIIYWDFSWTNYLKIWSNEYYCSWWYIISYDKKWENIKCNNIEVNNSWFTLFLNDWLILNYKLK